MTDDLIAFLNARLDEDEAAAKAAQSQDERHEQNMPDAEMRECIDLASRRERNYDQPWWAANMNYQLTRRRFPSNPARVLREVEAKRAVILQWENSPSGSLVLTNALYQLAAVYSDHPDYRAEWKP
jgi:hypothetical protein